MTPAQRKLIESRDLAWLQAHGDRSITNANRAAHDRHLLLQYIRALETGAAKETELTPEQIQTMDDVREASSKNR